MIIINFAEGHSQTLQMMYILLGKDPVNHSQQPLGTKMKYGPLV